MNHQSPITTHVLDTARGVPATDVPVALARHDGNGMWQPLGAGRTDADGRLRDLLPSNHALIPGVYRLVFDTGTYFAVRGEATFYPEVSIIFAVRETAPGEAAHYHVPLLLSPWGYSTYRGS